METRTTPTTDREIVVSRLLNAPRELVFKAWLDAENIGRWWGPRGFTTTTYRMDPRPGGSWRYTMHHDEYGDFENLIIYIEVVEPERLVYDHGDDVKVMFRSTITFEDRDGKTLLTMRSVFPTVEDRDRVVREYGAIEGAHQTLDRLEEHLASLQA